MTLALPDPAIVRAHRASRCVWCRASVRPTGGVYMALLWPTATVCVPCGRRQVACSCTVPNRQEAV